MSAERKDAAPRPEALPAGRERPILRVAQEDPKGCGVACLAMLTGMCYADVRATVPPAQVEHGLADQTIVWWLNHHGYWHRRSWATGEHAVAAPSRGFCIALTHDAHWVVIADGAVLDPARETPLSSYDWRQFIEVLTSLAAVERAS